MTRILYHRAGKVSARRLGLYMGIPADRRIRSSDRPDYLIRYGSRRSVPKTPSKRTINRRRMLNRYPDRLSQIKRMSAAGVRIPDFAESPFGVNNGAGILGRSNGKGRQTTRGKDIQQYRTAKTAKRYTSQHDFFTEFIPKDRQFRVHVIGGETRTRELVPDTDDPKEADRLRSNNVVWNYDSGDFIYQYPDDIPPMVVPIAVQAVKALWLDFGAVDVITHDRMAFVLEVNTAPGLADPTLEWYGDQLAGIVGIEDPPGWEAEGLEREDSDE